MVKLESGTQIADTQTGNGERRHKRKESRLAKISHFQDRVSEKARVSGREHNAQSGRHGAVVHVHSFSGDAWVLHLCTICSTILKLDA